MKLGKIILDDIPTNPGVYFIWRRQKDKIKFRKNGTGGHFKSKNPNVSISKLKEKWVNNAEILYIGQSNSLRRG